MLATTRKSLGVLLLLLALGLANAQVGAEISPANAQFSGKPGQTLTGAITVRNPTHAPVSLEVVPSDFVLTPDNRINPLPVSTLPASLASWLDLGVSAVDLAPGASRQYNYSITVPATAAPGTHWGAILFRTATTTQKGSSGVGMQVRAQVAFIVVVDIAPLTKSGKVTGVTLGPAKAPGASGTQTVTVSFQNTGDSYLRLEGRVELRKPDGTLVQTLSIAPTPSFPQELSNIPVKVGKPLAAGTYLATAILDYGTVDLVAGQATLTVH